MQKPKKLASKIFRRKSSESQRRKYFHAVAWCLTRGNDRHALDKYIECEDLPDTDWDAEDCPLRKDVEELAGAGQSTIPALFIKTVAKD